MSAELPQDLTLPEEVVEIAKRLTDAGFETWCVGGAIRDRLLGHADADVDLATAATPDQVQRLFKHTVPVGVKFGTVGVLDRRRVLHEVTTFRKDVATDGRHAVVEFGVSLDEDLARRDFTINAIAWHPIERRWRDPFHGADDLLDRRLVRAVGNPATRFAEDFLRILRMIRFAARFGFEIDPATWTAAVAGAPGLKGLSAERVREEWFKGLASARSIRRLVSLWREAGAAAIWIPELAEASPLAADAPESRDPVVLTAALTSDPAAVLRRLRGSNTEIGRAEAITRAPGEPDSAEPLAVRRWLARAGDAADDLLLLSRCRLGTDPPWAAAVAGVRARGEATSRKDLALTGDDLAASGVPAGPEMGRLLERLLDAAIDDPALNTREKLLALVRSWR
jgi:tRNA nucleotidyltransferase (CCA-adding enzyme)